MANRYWISCVLALMASGCGAPPDGYDPGDPFAMDDTYGEGAAPEEFPTEESSSPPPEVSPPLGGSLSFARATKERAYGVPIKDQKHEKPVVIYSIHLKNPSADEVFRLRAEVTLSRCNKKDVAGLSGDAKTTPCDSAHMKKNPYEYNPRFSAAFVLGSSANDAKGKRVSSWFDTSCSEGHHHCALAVPEVVLKDPPETGEMYLNLVVTADANGANAHSWDVMEVEQDHGGLYVTRSSGGAGALASKQSSEELLATGGMTVDRPAEDGDPTQVRRLLYQVELSGLQGGDVVDADAKMRAINGNYSCDPLITGQLILTADKKSREPTGPHDEVLTAKNGHNLSDHSSQGSRYEKSGAAQLDAKTASKMYLSYVVIALRSCADPGGTTSGTPIPRPDFSRPM